MASRRWTDGGRASRGMLYAMSNGYSGTPLATKLGLKQGHVLALLRAPDAWPIPGAELDLEVRRDLRRRPDIVIVFVRSRSDLCRQARRVPRSLAPDASLWVAWPRKAGGHVSDVTEQALRDELLPCGLVDNKVAALDEDWSGLRFVWRREHRASLRQAGRVELS